MCLQDVFDMARDTGLPAAYDHFAEGEPQNPPYLVFRIPESHGFAADGVNYFPIAQLDFELYSDRKDPELERNVEDVLREHGILFDKSEFWIGEERLFEVLYEMEVGYE